MNEHPKVISSVSCVEWAAFRLRTGVSGAALLAASERLETEFLRSSPGYLQRVLLSGEKGEYVNLVRWRSRADAEAVMFRVAESAACQVYFALMDLEVSGAPSFFDSLWAYSGEASA